MFTPTARRAQSRWCSKWLRALCTLQRSVLLFICIQVIFAFILWSYIEQCTSPASTATSSIYKHEYEYVAIPNHRGSVHHVREGRVKQYHLLSPDTMSGLIDATFFVSQAHPMERDANLRRCRLMCDARDDCIGFAVHDYLHHRDVSLYYSSTSAQKNADRKAERYDVRGRQGGALFYNMSAYPLQFVRGWTFHLKNGHEMQHRVFEQSTHWTASYAQRNGENPRAAVDAPDDEERRWVWYYYAYSQRELVRDNPQLPWSLVFAEMTYERIPLLPREFVSFEWNMGRTNNQIMSFEAMLQYAVMYQRAILLPFGSHFNHFQGIFYDGLWDFEYLSLMFDFAYEFEIGEQHARDKVQRLMTYLQFWICFF